MIIHIGTPVSLVFSLIVTDNVIIRETEDYPEIKIILKSGNPDYLS